VALTVIVYKDGGCGIMKKGALDHLTRIGVQASRTVTGVRGLCARPQPMPCP
jgi:hypothetical protein